MLSMRKTMVVLLFVMVFFVTEAKKKYSNKQLELQKKETNPVMFISLVIMRLVYGLAHSMGLSERLNDFMGGAFVPPGAEEDYEIADFDY